MDIKIAKFKNGAKSAYSFVFDDGCYVPTIEKTIKVFEKVKLETGIKIKATSAQTVNFIEKENVQGFWEKIIEDGWYDISSHSVDHSFSYNESVPSETRRNDAELSQKLLREMYPSQKIATFVTPNGGETPEGCKVLEQFYFANRNGNDYINDVDNLNWFDIGTFTVKIFYKTAKPYTDYIDEVISKGGWAVQLNHWLTNREDDAFHAQKADTFEDECMYLGKKAMKNDIWIASFNEAALYFKEYQNSEIQVNDMGFYKEVRLNCSLDKRIFDYPLTLELTTARDVAVIRKNSAETIKSVDGKAYIQIAPNETIKIK